MDPNVCLQRILEALKDQDRDEAHAALLDLAEWLDKGGAFPDPQECIRVFLDRLERS